MLGATQAQTRQAPPNPLPASLSSAPGLGDTLGSRTWRLNNLYWITTKEGRVIPFRLNWAQEALLDRLHKRNVILKARQLGFCLDPSTRILTAALTWVPIADLAPGEEIISVDEYPLTKGKGSARKMRTATVQAAVKVQRQAYRIVFDDGRSVVCTGQHPWLSRKAGSECDWRKIENGNKKKLTVGTRVRWITKPWDKPDYEDGWFGGVLDGEGSISLPKAGSAEINASQRHGVVWDRIIAYARDRGYSARVESDKAERKNKYGKSPVLKLCFSRIDELFRLIGQTRPTRFIENRFWEGKHLPGKRSGVGWAKIVSIEPLGERAMIDLQTSSGTYIAEGFVSHNTTFIDLFILDAALFNKNLRCGIIAHHRDDARVIFRDKIQFAYNNLDRHPLGRLVKQTVTADQSTAMELTFSNGSNIRVSTSFRSGTLQMLHVSEYAKLCARYPSKAQEIRTGALNAVAKGQLIFVESTAEGRAGHFYELCTEAAKHEALGQKITELDFKRHFFPWWKHPEYVLDPAGVVISQELQGYFKDLEIGHGIYLTDDQKAWYSKMKDTQRDEMCREYPSTEEEAFLAAILGAYYGTHMAKVRKERRICGVPYDPRFPVNTAWDLGVGDMMTILFHQKIGGEHHLIDAYKNHGEGLAFYVRILQERKYVYGNHYLPHDIEARELGTGTSRLEVLRGLMPGANLVVVPRLDIPDGIEAVRNILGACWFDQAKTDEILVKALESYQREWDEDLGVFKAKPLHDHNSHPADAMRYLATGLGYYPAAAGPIGVKGPTAKWKRRKRSAMVV